MKRTLTILSSALLFSLTAIGQTFKVESLRQDMFDISGSAYARLDLDKEKCGLLKVRCVLNNVTFKGNVMGDVAQKDGEYWVYLPVGTKLLAIHHPKLKPLMINFEESIGEPIQSSATYIIDLSIPEALYNAELGNGTVSVGKQDGDFVKGQYEMLVAKGQRNYDNKDFKLAKEAYHEASSPMYSAYFSPASFAWIDNCNAILEAQKTNQAITPELAASFKNIEVRSNPFGFSDGMMVVDNGYGSVSLIGKDGNRVELSETFLNGERYFKEGSLPLTIGENRVYVNKSGQPILNYRISDNDMFRNFKFEGFNNGLAVAWNEKNGKKGIIHKSGAKVFEPGKYDDILILKDKIILGDGKGVYEYKRWDDSYHKLTKGDFKKLFDYQGSLRWDSNENIIITYDFQKSDDLQMEYQVYTPKDGNSTTYKVDGLIPTEAGDMLLIERFSKDWYLVNPQTKDIKFICSLKSGIKPVFGNNIIFDGKNIYNFSGEKIKSLPETLEFDRGGFNDGYILVKNGNSFWYMDEEGNMLPNSKFTSKHSFNELFVDKKYPFNEGFGLIVRDGKWGLVDKFGNTTFDF